ncbi:hypothetical protein FRC06_006526 [Ceratobasidium sp. 370]|nr:hypothetical protein FRC06_006526 [Ceratobasidium sp. 370]
MMNELERYDLKQLKGVASRVHCVLHVVGLVVKAIMFLFRTKREQLAAACAQEGGTKIEECREHNPEDQDIDEDDDGFDTLELLGEMDEEEYGEIVVPKMEAGSPALLEQAHIVKFLFKCARFAHRLCYRPKAKKEFLAICAALAVARPHNIRRDQQICCNSTGLMLEDTERTWPAILEWQKASQFLKHNLVFNVADIKVLWYLLGVLKSFTGQFAVEIAEQCWHEHYKPVTEEVPTVSGGSQFGYSEGYLEAMYSKLRPNKPPSACPVKDFIYMQPLTSSTGSPIINDPLGWWDHQCAARHEYNRMTQMALDVLSTPM